MPTHHSDFADSNTGFTIVELLIVSVIVGVLTAVALPRYLQARAAARMGSRIGEAIAVARECQVFVISGIGSAPDRPAPDPIDGGVSVEACDRNSGIEILATWPQASRAAQVPCLSARSDLNSASATLAAQINGPLSCRFN